MAIKNILYFHSFFALDLPLMRHMRYTVTMNFIAIDFETANYSRNSACAVGLVRFVAGEPVDNFYSLIRPPKLFVRPDFTQIHGITVRDIQHEVTFKQLWENGLLAFLQKDNATFDSDTALFPFVAHNAGFDMTVLRSVLDYYKLATPRIKSVCSLRIAQKVWPHFNYHKLTLLAERFKIKYNAHNALDDALVCGKIMCLAAAEKGVKTLDELLKTSGVIAKPL